MDCSVIPASASTIRATGGLRCAPGLASDLRGLIEGDRAHIVHSEPQAVIRAVPARNLQKRFDEMELTIEVRSAECPHYGTVKLVPGCPKSFAFTARAAELENVTTIELFKLVVYAA